MVFSNSLSRRQLLRASLAIGGVAMGGRLLGGCAPTQSASSHPPTTAITIGFVPIACAAPLLAADALGSFDSQGLKVVLRKFSGWAELWTAYATGEIDVAHMLSPMPLAIDAGATSAARPTELAFTQNTNGQALTLAESHHPQVQSAQDLRGMILGIPFEYSVHAFLLRDYLAAHGVSPVSDVELRLLRPADMIAQLTVGTIDGFIGPEPFNQRALKTKAGRIFLPTKHMWEGHPCCSVAIAKSIDRGVRDAIVAALHIGAAYVDNPEHTSKAAPILAQEKYLNQNAALIEPALQGAYTAWDDSQLVDPEMINFGAPTSATAITWMATQIARWNLGGTGLSMNDQPLRAAATSVLPVEADVSLSPEVINGQVFDPTRPTLGYSA